MTEQGEPFVCLDHDPVQHRDGKTPWCRVCGLDDDGNEPDAATGLDRVTEGSVRHVKRLTTELYRKRESLNDQRREFRKLLAKARAGRDAALAEIERVRAIHRQLPVVSTGFPPPEADSVYCANGCDAPCATLAALDEAPEAERDAALAAIERVQEVHKRELVNSDYGGTRSICIACERPYPCQTIEALDEEEHA